MIKLCRGNHLIWPMGVGGSPNFYPINPTASQVMSPTDLPQCHQLPGDSAKLLDNPVGMPASGSGTQAPAQVRRMLREVVHLHRGDEETSRERFVYEQQEAYNAAAQREHQHTELEEIAGSLRAEITIQAEQHLNHFLQQEQACFTSHLKNVESHLQAEVANTRFHLQQEYLVRTSEVEERAAASECAYASMHRELPGAKRSTPGQSSSPHGRRYSPPRRIH